jgi:hypothetical protein
VDTFEPQQALYLEDEIYEHWFQDFFKGVRERLKVGGSFFMEGHELELEKQALELESLGFKNIKVLSDLALRERYIQCTLT